MESNEVTLVLKIKTIEDTTPEVVTRLAGFAAISLHRMFGEQRFEIWWEGQRYVFDALAQDGEHYGHDIAGRWIKP